MLTRTKLIIDVREILSEVGSRRDLAFDEPIEDLEVDLARVRSENPVSFDLVIERIEGGVLVRGSMQGRYVTSCRRCLTETGHDFSLEATEVYRPPSDEWDNRYVVTDERIDLDPLVRDNVLTELPQYPLCRPDCKGLCPTCGVNLNTDDCDCEPIDVDLRWAALKDLLPDD